MSINCCVLGCFDQGKYGLPYKNPAIWKNWLKSCPYLQPYSLRQLEYKRICAKHFIPEHFDNHTDLTKKAVPLLYLPRRPDVTIDDEPENTIQTNEDIKEEIQTIEDSIDPSLDPVSIEDESIHYDTEECIPMQQSEEIEFDPLQMSPKQSPIDFNCYEESVIAHSPPPEPNHLEDPPQLMEYSECSPIIKPQPMKVPRVVLHRLPLILQHCRVYPPPPLTPKPQPNSTNQNKQNGDKTIYFNRPLRDSITYFNLQKETGSPPVLVPANRIAKLRDKQLLKTYRNKLSKNSELFCSKAKYYLLTNNLSSNFGKTLTGTGEGAHYTTKEKVLAFTLFKISPKSYNFLMRYLIGLPSKDRINSILNDIPLRPGINEFIFQHLADAARHKSEEEKECTLLFGEMKTNKYLKFNVHTGIIEGFQDLGSGKRAKIIGDKVLVFILCDLFQLWKLPIAYYVTGDLTEHNNVIFQKILSEILLAVFETGFVVKATISDHSSKYVEAINSFLAKNDNSEDNIYYKIDNKRLFHIYDVKDTLKCLEKDSRNDNQHAQWVFLESLFQTDNDEKGDKTLTKNCTLESTVSSQAVNVPAEVEFWDSALHKLNNLQEGQTKLLPVHLFIHNAKTTKKVWEDFQARASGFVSSLNLKSLNFIFREIMEQCVNNSNINSNQFIKAYRKVLISNLVYGKSLYTMITSDDDKILSVLENYTSTKKYSPYYDDVDLEQIIFYVKQIATGLPTLHGFCNYFVSNMPYKDCGLCQKSILSTDQSINLAVSKSINLVDEMVPEMLNFQIYPLILILQQEVDTSWFACTVHKTQFFKIFWIFIIKVRVKKWCSYFNNTTKLKSQFLYLKNKEAFIPI